MTTGHGSENSQRKRHVYIVEDEEFGLRTLGLMLEAAGYTVQGSTDGMTALSDIRRIIRSGDHIDLLLCDMIMFGINGLELYDELLKSGIRLPILPMSGFFDKGVEQQFRKRGCQCFLRKPYTQEHLLEAIRTAMEPPDPRTAG
jgi:FixJ family two-component response regulator